MSAEHCLRPGDPGIRAALAGLGVNVGRMQREDTPATVAGASWYRVLIDIQPSGAFTVYSDADVEVICRCVDVPEDELVRVDHSPIPEEWLDGPIGHCCDGSVPDLLAEVIADWPDL